MTDALTLAQLATVAGIAASIFAVLNVALRWLVEYLSAKFGAPGRSAEAAGRQAQSEQCRFDHSNINNVITAQNANIARMLEQNGRLLESMKDASHVSELRHQIVLTKLDRIIERQP